MTELRQRQPRVENKAFLAFVRLQRCCACDAFPPVQAAHVRMGSRAHGKRPTGTGEKPDDRWTVPLCARCHLNDSDSLHRTGEQKFWRTRGVDPFTVALAVYSAFLLQAASGLAPKIRRPKRKRHEIRLLEIVAKSSGQLRKGRWRTWGSGKATGSFIFNANRWPKGRKIANRRRP